MKINSILLMILFAVQVLSTVNAYQNCSEAPDNICGPNAKCYDQRDTDFFIHGGPYCKCNRGFIGKPPNCKDGCRKDDGCNDDEYCNDNMKCKKGCRSGFCPDDQICDETTRECRIGCSWDENCKDDEYCNESYNCQKGCRFHSCKEGTICDEKSRQCIEGCSFINDCKNDEYCKENKCRKICDDFSCGDNTKCLGKDHKKLCTCIDGYTPSKNRKTGCEKTINKVFNCEEFCANGSLCKEIEKKSFCYCLHSFDDNPFFQCIPPRPEPTQPPPTTALKPGGEDSISLAAIAAIGSG